MTTSELPWVGTLAAAEQPTAAEPATTQVVFIDSRVPDIQDLVAGAQPGETVFVLDPDSDGLDQIASDLASAGLSNLSALSIVGHGASGQMLLGSTLVDEADLASHADALAAIGAALTPGGDLSLYGCDVAEGAAGAAFIADLSAYAGGVDVAAATHLVGSADHGGSFVLDASTGAPVTASAFTQTAMAQYEGVLGTAPASTMAGDSFVLTAFVFGNVSNYELDSVDDTGAYPQTATTYDEPQTSQEPSAIPTTPAGQAPTQIAIDPQNNTYVLAVRGGDSDSDADEEIFVGRLSDLNTATYTAPTLLDKATQTSGGAHSFIGSLTLDPVAETVLFTEDNAFNSIPYGGGTVTTFKTLTTQTGAVNSDSIVASAIDTKSHDAYFFAQDASATVPVDKSTGMTANTETHPYTKNQISYPTRAHNYLYEDKAYTSGGGNISHLTFSMITNGSITSAAVDSTESYVYFSVESNAAGIAGVYKYNLGTQKYSQIAALTSLGLKGSISGLEIEGGKYYFTYLYNNNAGSGETAAQSGVYVGNLDGSPVSLGHTIAELESTPTANLAVSPDIALDQAPTLSVVVNTSTYTVGGTAVAPISNAIDGDPDGNGDLASATVAISNYQLGDTLAFTLTGPITGPITGSYTAGTLTLNGPGTYAQYEAALDSVTFSSTSENLTTRSIAYSVNDGLVSSSVLSVPVMIVVPPPVVGGGGNTVSYTEAGTAATVDSGVTVQDPAGAIITGATVTIASGFFAGDTLNFMNQNTITGSYDMGTGMLTLSGSTSATNYQTALRSISFSSPSQNPDDYGKDPSRTVTFQVSDANASSGTATSTVDVTAVNNPPVLSGTDTKTFTQGANGATGTAVLVDDALLVTDPDNQNLAGATVTITNGLSGDELKIGGSAMGTTNGITYSYDASTYTLMLTGPATLATFQTVLGSITFDSTSLNPTSYGTNTSRIVAFVASDGSSTNNTNAAYDANVTIAPTDQPPVVTASGGTAIFDAIGATSTPVVVDGGVTVTDPDNTTLASATVTITNGEAGDMLGFTNTSNATEGDISGSYSAGVLSLTSAGHMATLAQFQAALDAVTFANTSASPDATPRTISFAVSDGTQSDTAGQTDTVDIQTAPTITSVTATTSNGTADLDSGQSVTIAVTFSEVVTVTGGPTLQLNDGLTAGGVTGSGTSTLSFVYIVGQTDNDADLTVQGVALNNGTIQDSQGRDAVTSNAATDLHIQIDTTPPAAPSTPTDASVVNGYVNAANDLAAQTVTGMTEIGSSVEIFDNKTALGAATVDMSGNYSYMLGHLTDGAYSLTAQATDMAGNVGTASQPLAFTVDTMAPAASTPADASVVNGYVNAANDTAAQTVTGTTEIGSSVEIFDNKTALGAATVDGSGDYSYMLGHLTDGPYSLTAQATDMAGNVGTASQPLAFTVDTMAPAASTPADASVVNGYVNAANDTAAQTVTGTTEIGSSVEIFDNKTALGAATVDGSGDYSYMLGHLTDGPYSLTAQATDMAGNVGTASQPLAFTVDTMAPAASTPADASVVNGYVNAANDTAAQTVTGTTEIGSSVEIFDNKTALGAATVDGSGDYSYMLGHLTDGAYSLTAQATDMAGNVGTASQPLAFTVDTMAPAASTPADASVVNGYVNAANDTAAQTVTGTTEIGSSVEIFDNKTALGAATVDGSGDYSYMLGHLTDGPYSLTAQATDMAGNVGTASQPLAFTVDTMAPAASTPADASVVNGYVNAANDTAAQTVTGTTEIGSSVEIFDNKTALGAATVDGSGDYSYMLGHITDGPYSLTAQATDMAGNVGTASQPLAFTVDTMAPAASTPADASVVNGYVNAANDTAAQTVTGTTEIGSSVEIFDNKTALGAATVDGSGDYSYMLGHLTDGPYSLTAQATDMAGNVGTASQPLAFTVDTMAPAASTPADASVVNGYVNAANDTAAQTVTGTTEIGSSVEIFDNKTALGAATVDGSGDYSYMLGHLTDGPYSLTAQATDMAGNVGTASQPLAFTVDTMAPTIASEVASPTGVDLDAGKVVTFTIATSEAVTATGSSLTLSNGATAAYNATSSTPTSLVYTYNVASADTNTTDLEAMALNGAITDGAGNPLVDASFTTIDTTDQIDTIAPTITPMSEMASPTGRDLKAGGAVTFTISTSEAVTATGSSLTLSNGATAAYNAASSTPTSLVYTYTVASADTNTTDLEAMALNGAITDGAGNALVDASFTTIDTQDQIDTIAPTAPTLALTDDTGVSSSDQITSNPAITYTPSASGDTLLYKADGAASYSTTAPVFATDGSQEGPHTVSVEEEDTAGNISPAASLTFTLDTIAPSVAISAPSPNSSVSIIDPTISGTVDVADAGSTVTLTSGQTVLGTAIVASDGAWSDHLTFGTDGTYAVTASDTDAAGNIGQSSDTFTINSTPNEDLFGAITHDVTSAGGQIYALFETILGRPPDPVGFEGWVADLNAGTPLTTIAQDFLGSFEYANDYGSSVASDSAFINQLYEDGLHRAAEPGGLQTWENALANGTTRAQVAVDIATSQESDNDLSSTFQTGVFVPNATDSAIARLYYAVLDRAPDAPGLASWEADAQQGTSLTTIASDFLGSAEYAGTQGTPSNAAFVNALYESALGRADTDPGAQGWITALNQGASRASVVVGIAESQEATLHLSPAIEAGFHIA